MSKSAKKKLKNQDLNLQKQLVLLFLPGKPRKLIKIVDVGIRDKIRCKNLKKLNLKFWRVMSPLIELQKYRKCQSQLFIEQKIIFINY